ncbi:HAD family hydrolase [Caldimonas sp. KR1-144]|uniref:HAD family hydrolase n=1 Tax=Caldimonas sp. KR1-144 TaxID=3400911 RepID=UPI003BFE75AC
MFAAAIFDMDGLLLDSERSIMRAWIEAAAEAGIALSEQAYLPIVGQASRQADALLAALLGGQAAFEQIRENVLAKLSRGCTFPPKPGAVALLAALTQRGIPCAVASSTAVCEVRQRIGLAGMEHFFSALAGGDEVEAGKPDPAIYRLAAHRLAIDPARCLAFEDSTNGIRAARAAGMAVVVVPDLVQPDLREAFAMLPSLAEAEHLIGRWFGAQRSAAVEPAA